MPPVRHLTAAALVATLTALSSAAIAQQPPALQVYSDAFESGSGSGTAAPGSAQRGTTITVDVAVLAELERLTQAVRARMDAHMADTGAHQPHSHPHDHGDGRPAVYSALDHHRAIRELLVRATSLLARVAHAQTQPPPLVVYDDDMSGPTTTAPTTTGTNLNVMLNATVPLVATVRSTIAQLDAAITAHVAARPGHAHSHPHSH